MSTLLRAGLRLSVWRPASFSRNYMETKSGAPLHSGNHQEEIYRWDTGPHEPAIDFRNSLGPFFDERTPPRDRSVAAFRDAVSLLFGQEVPSDAKDAASLWSDSQDTVATSEGEMNLRVNATLGTLRQFLWVAQVFSSVPEASVLLR